MPWIKEEFVSFFGILLLKAITGKKALDVLTNGSEAQLVSWVSKLRETGRVLEVIDPTFSDFSQEEIKGFIDVSLCCIQSSSRPKIPEVMRKLLRFPNLCDQVFENLEDSFCYTSKYFHEDVFGRKTGEEKISQASHSSQSFASPVYIPTLDIGRTQSNPATTAMSKSAHVYEKEIEIEHELDAHSSGSVQMKLKHELVTVSSPSAKISSPSSLSTDVHAHEETSNNAEEILMSDGVKAEIQMGQPSQSQFLSDQSAVKAVTKSLGSDSSIQSEEIKGLSFQAETDEVLSDAVAWDLFCFKVGDIIDSPKIKPYAQAISHKCYGSSVIISAIGFALRAENSVEEWNLALTTLQFAESINTNNQCFFTPHIKYCFDRLKARDVKTCFLYTALFQEDKEIDKSTLVECFISEGLVGGTTTMAYKKGHDIVGCLTNASLLEINDNGLKLKMHRVVRDSALEILSSDIEGYQVFVRLLESKKGDDQSYQESSNVIKQFDKSSTLSIHKYLTRAGANLKESPSKEEWEQATMIFLMDNELSSVPSKPNCSALVALLLQRNSCLRVIPTSFFESMSTLKILNLSNTRIKVLPDSISRLSTLQILLLRDCERLLVLPPLIGLLKSLEVLDLQGTYITHLPDTVCELTSLKQLRVSFYGSMNRSEYKKLPTKLVSHGIISYLKVRELGMFVYPGDQRWTLNASSMTKEISKLKLSVLYYHFPKVEDLEYFMRVSQSWKEKYLTTFNIVVGHDFKRIVSLFSNDEKLLFNEGQQSLRFVNGEDIPVAVVEVLSRTTSFCLDHHINISYLSQFGIHSLDGLKFCILMDCPELIGIIDGHQEQRMQIFPALEYLSVSSMWNMKSIWAGHVAMGSLTRLRCLSVHACPKLRYVFTSSMLEDLINLEELVIEDCASLKYLVVKDEDVEEILYGDAEYEIDIEIDEQEECEFPVLRSLKVLKLHYLQELCGIWRGHWPTPLEYISFYNCPKLNNLHMKDNDGELIKEIAADKAWWDSLKFSNPNVSERLGKSVTEIQIDD